MSKSSSSDFDDMGGSSSSIFSSSIFSSTSLNDNPSSKRCKIAALASFALLLTSLVGTLLVVINGDAFKNSHNDPGVKGLTSRHKAYKAERLLSSLADLTEPLQTKTDSPVLWLVPRTNGMAVKDIMKQCFQQSFATEFKPTDHQQPDAIVTHMLYRAASTFEAPHQGRMFTVLRDPLERTVDMYAQETQDANTNTNPKSLEDYLLNHVNNNWLTRFLTNEYTSVLTDEHVETAKAVLKDKCVVGLSEQLHDSVDRFAYYFHWDMLNLENQQCTSEILRKSSLSGGEDGDLEHVPMPEKDTDAYTLLTTRNNMDLQVYEYAKELFVEQKETLFEDLHHSSTRR